jgi:hypothetical protein
MKRQIFGIVAGVSALFMTSGLIAEEVKWAADAEGLKKDWKGKIKYETVDGKLAGVVDNRSDVFSSKLIPVEDGKKYTLSGTFKSLGETPSLTYYGFICYDKNKRKIETFHSNVILGSATTLAQDCKKGDKTIVIKANKKWKLKYYVAFNAKDDFSDLPNYGCGSGDRIAKITPSGDNMELELLKPLKKSYPAGTKLRAHTSSYGSYVYATVCAKKVPKQWKAYSQNVTIAKPGKMSYQLLRPGTAFVKIVILANYNKKADEKTAFTGLAMKEAE